MSSGQQNQSATVDDVDFDNDSEPSGLGQLLTPTARAVVMATLVTAVLGMQRILGVLMSLVKSHRVKCLHTI